jgi:hypothetical protein
MTYESSSGGQLYTFIISMDQQGNVSVREIRTPTGGLCDATAQLPQSVLDDIDKAICQMRMLMGRTSATSGNLAFVAETSREILFHRPFSDTDYRIVLTADDFIALRAVNKTVIGFTLETDITYTGNVGFDVFVAESSDASGILEFSAETIKTVTLPVAFNDTNYRVALGMDDFIAARIVGKTTTSFDVELDVTYTGEVSYDVFAPLTSGNITFAAETTKPVSLSIPAPCTGYRVVFTVPDFIAVRAINKTLTGFDIETDITFTGDIGYDVFI